MSIVDRQTFSFTQSREEYCNRLMKDMKLLEEHFDELCIQVMYKYMLIEFGKINEFVFIDGGTYHNITHTDFDHTNNELLNVDFRLRSLESCLMNALPTVFINGTEQTLSPELIMMYHKKMKEAKNHAASMPVMLKMSPPCTDLRPPKSSS